MTTPSEQTSGSASQHDAHSQRSREIMIRLRADEKFMENLNAALQNPERAKKIAEGLHANTADRARRRADALLLRDNKPLPNLLWKLSNVGVDQQNYAIADAYKAIRSDLTRRNLAELLDITKGQQPEDVGPLRQGFLLMAAVYEQLGSPIRPETSTMQRVRETINDQDTQEKILRSLSERTRISYHVHEIAAKRFAPVDADNPSAIVTQKRTDQQQENEKYFIFGAALAYNMHERMVVMRCKAERKRNPLP